MSRKVCYITTLPITLKAFVVKSAIYNKKNRDWDITFICDETPGFQKELPEGIRYIPVRIKRGVSLSGFVSTIRLFKVFKKEKFDLVQYSTSNAGCYASIAAFLARIPVRLYCQWGLDYPAFSGIKKILFFIIEYVTCKCSTNIQPDSKSNLNICFKDHLYDSRKGCVIGEGSSSGVDLNRFDIKKRDIWRCEIRDKYEIKKDVFVFGFLGRFLKDKGVNELLLAAFGFLNRHENVVFLMVGDYNTREGINESLFEKARSDKRFVFTGFSSEAEKYYAAMDILILPTYHEGFPTSILETQAMGTPPIVSEVPGAIDAIRNNKTGKAVKVKSVKGIENAMEELYSNTEQITDFQKAGRKLIEENYDQNIIFDLILKNRTILLDS